MKTPSFCQLLRTCSYQSSWSRTELPCQFHHQSQAEACHSEFHAIPHHGKNKSYRENYGFLWQMAKTAVSSWSEMPLPKAQNGVRQKNTMRQFAWKSSGVSYLATTTVSDRDAIMERCSILFTSCPSTAAASAFARIVKMFALGIAVVIMVLDQHCTKIIKNHDVLSQD